MLGRMHIQFKSCPPNEEQSESLRATFIQTTPVINCFLLLILLTN